MNARLLLILAAVSFLKLSAAPAAVEDARAGVDFFEKKIRPVLSDRCYKCHSESADKIKGGLVLDSREGIRKGGDNGPAVVPGDLNSSLLIEAVRYHNKDTAMPPEKAGGKLSEAAIHDFEEWVSMGAPDPRTEPAKLARKQDSWESARSWWAWQSFVAPERPKVKDEGWSRNDIDRFVLAGLETKGLHPVGDADPFTLIRRLYFDLTGLPPTPEQATAFVQQYRSGNGQSAAAMERVVDQLLTTPQFGERWGRHWLDVARYAESTGKEANIAYPHAWRYRDYVVAAFNSDKPYDQFLREQLAGDLLPAQNNKQRAEQIVATGFLALGPKSLNEQNPRQFALDLADEQIDTVSQSLLGLTVACARCHDHKFDPIPQREYYALAGIFLSTDTKYGTPKGLQNRRASELIALPADAGLPVLAQSISGAELAGKQQRLEDLRKEQRELAAERFRAGGKAGANNQQANQRVLRLIAEIGQLEAELASYDTAGKTRALAMGVQDLPAARERERFYGGGFGDRIRQRLEQRFGGGRPPEFSTIGNAPLFARGEPDKPGDKVPRGFLTLLGPSAAPTIPAGTSGRRELAEWIASPQNPLTARVMANRVWGWLFGRGIVDSPDNFGTTGAKPDNQALLDYLASQFVANGWSVKKLVREIAVSRTYQLASTFNPQAFAADPENRLIWRMNQRRLDAECLRDAMLSVSGQLQLAAPVGSLIAEAGDGPVGGRRYRGVSEETVVNSGATTNVRSLYLPIARDLLPEALAVFDFPEPSLVAGARETTNVPAQALYLLNSPSVAKAARKLSERLVATYPAGPGGGVGANLEQRVRLAYSLVFSRMPTEAEKQAAFGFFTSFPGAWHPGDTRPVVTHDSDATSAAWTSFCRALFASAEFRFLN